MQRKLVLAIIALIGLGSLAVLGNSPEFIKSMVEAVRTGSVSSIFTAPERSEPAANEVRTGEPAQTIGSPNISEETLWQIVFTVADGLVDREQKVPADQAGLFNNYFTRQGKFSADNDAALKEIAAQFIAGMEPLEKRAAPVIEKARAKYKTLAERQKAGPPAELVELQRERNQLTLRMRDEFRDRIGEEAYADFSKFIKTDLLSGVKSVPLPTEGEQLSPQAFLMFTIIIWDDGLPIPLITGIGGTVVDFFDGFYYDPWVGSELYNWSTNQTLHIGTDRGARWIYPALVFHPVYPTARNQWYCNYTIHYAIDRIIFFKQNGIDPGKMSDLNPLGTDLTAPQDAYYLGELQVCHLVQDQCESLTGVACQTPTPTPSPSPTPVEVKSVSFLGDHVLHKFPSDVVITDPTWYRGDSENAENVVAYTKNPTDMSLEVSFDINPAPPPGDSVTLKIQAKYNGQVIAASDGNVTVTQSPFTITDMDVTHTILEPTAQVKKGNYTFNWEVSADNGQTWRPAGNTQHVIYWVNADPLDVSGCANDNVPRNCPFVNGFGKVSPSNEYPFLYDKALSIGIDDLTPAIQTPGAIAKHVAYKIDDWVRYDPGDDQNDSQHPLHIWTGTRKAQCSANANLLHGILRTIGIESETIYFWGGKQTNTEFGGKVHPYHWRQENTPTTFYDRIMGLRAKRPRKNSGGENIPENPHFAFHSMVKLNGQFYDPSYGKDIFNQSGYPFTNQLIDEAIRYRNDDPTKPEFVNGNETPPHTVQALNMQKFCIPSTSTSTECAANPETVYARNKYCRHSVSLYRTTVPGFISHFDGDEITDFAIWRPSDGSWWVINSSTQSPGSYGTWGLSGDKPVPADYDGDGKTDLAVFRPSNGGWYIIRSSDYSIDIQQFGLNGDRPVFGDFEGDGKNDIAVWRPSDGIWYWITSSDGGFHGHQFGLNGDVPVSGDYNGDGKTDFMVYRPSNGIWYLHTGSSYTAQAFGLANDIPVTGDFDSDGKDDIAVWRPSDGVWYLQQSTDGFTAFQFGSAGDVPMTGQFNADSRVDVAVWNPANGVWTVLNLNDLSYSYVSWGLPGDIPIPSAYNR